MNFLVRVTPNSKKNSIKEYRENILYIKISKPPIENKVNNELVKFLEEIFDVKGIKILSGLKSREKVIYIPIDENIFNKKIKNFLK